MLKNNDKSNKKYYTSKKRRDNMFKKLNKNLHKDRYWKEKNKKYLKELQNFLDKADNIDDESLRKKVIEQMLRCDNVLTELAEFEFKRSYKLGYIDGKNE